MEVRPGYKQTEVGVIPEDWDVKPLSTMPCEVVDCHHSTPVWTSDGVIVIRNQNIRNGKLVLTEPSYTDEKHYQERIRRATPCFGDLVITREAPVGQICMIPSDLQCCLGQRMVLLRISPDSADNLYVLYAIQAEPLQRYIAVAGGTGSTVSNLRIPLIKSLPIPTPGPVEQRAIAIALSDVDVLLGGLDRLITKKRDLKQAVMQQLLTGQTRLPGFHGKWEVKRLGDIADTDPENLSSSTYPNYTFNYIALEDVNRGCLEGYSEITYSTAPSRARRRLREGDILMATVRPNLKAHLLFKGFSGEWVCSTGFCVIRSRRDVSDSGYLMQHLFAHPINKQIEALIAGSNYPAINNKDVRALDLPVLPYKEQVAIATVLSDMDAEIDALEQRREKTRALKQAMMQELLTGRIRLA